MQSVITTIETHVQRAKKPLIVLVGPTASGKTGLSINIAKALNTVEVINADSRQLYRYLDIGTAKITSEEMQGVPHHLLDVLDPTEEVSVGWYKREACKVIDALHAQQKVPMLVGGSMLYISAIVDNFTLPVPIDPAIREGILKELEEKGLPALYEELVQVDPAAAQHIHAHNTQHVLRAIELYRQTGTSKVETLKNARAESPYDILQIGIKRERADIVERINTRTELMFDQGWLDEVKGLLEKGYTKVDPGMKSTGYRECIEYLESGNTDLEQLKEAIGKQTRDYAKRQMTWWKRDKRIQWCEY